MPPHPPVKVTVYGNEPETVGVPEIVTAFEAHEPETPAGKPVTVAPVAPVVAKVIEVIAVLIHVVLLLPAATVLSALTVMETLLVDEQPTSFVAVAVKVSLLVNFA